MKSIILFLTLIFLSVPAFSQEPPVVNGGGGQQGPPPQRQGGGGPGGQNRRGPGLPEFATIDKDKDGKLSKAEWNEFIQQQFPPQMVNSPQIAQIFDQLDANHDGSISKDEYAQAQQVMQRTFRAQGGGQFGAFSFVAGQLLQVLDTDSDKKLSRKEFDGMKTTVFDKLDKDKDGFLTAEELSGLTTMVPRQPGTGGPGGQRGDGQGRQGRPGGQGGQPGQNNQGNQTNAGGQGGQRGGQPGQPGGPGGGGGQRARNVFNFDELDKNKDGKIAPDEWLNNQDIFKQVDTNNDGFISREEMDSFNQKARARQMAIWITLVQSLDTNYDGKLSREEFGKLTDFFDKMDKNKDGFLANDELMAMANIAHETQIEATSGIPIDQFIAKFDKNGDGKLSAEEMAGNPTTQKLFNALDKNKDGFLTRDEIVAYVQLQADRKAKAAAAAQKPAKP